MSATGGNTFRWALRTALRDARGSKARALLYALSMALGIAALVAMGSLEADMAHSVDDQTREMVGADLLIRSRQPFSDATQAFFRKIPGEAAHFKSFAGMAGFPKAGASHLARVRAIDGPYPFFGEMETVPAEAAQTYQEGRNALVARSLMERVGAEVGDPLHLGQATFTIVGILERSPGETFAMTNLGPRICIPHRYLEETQLIRVGSRVFYVQAFDLREGVDPDHYVADHEALFKQARLSWDTVQKRKENLGEAMGNLGDYLNLTACLALLLGGLGVAGAVHYHIRRKTRQVATLRCIGATNGQVTLVYLIQVTLMTLAAIGIGVVLGVGIQFLLPLVVKGVLPVRFEPSLQIGAVLLAAAWGLLMSLLLAAMPLLRLRHISPMMCFRPDAETAPQERVWAPLVVILCWWLFACIRTGSLLHGSIFAGGLLVSLGLLAGTARLLGAGARAMVGKRWPFVLRHALGNLFRPHNQTSAFLVILGMGVFLITVLAGMRTMLLAGFQGVIETSRPNFIAFDIQPDQVEGVRKTVESLGLPVRDLVPIVPMRLGSLKGKPIAEYMGDLPDWSLQREYRSTYRADLVSTETLTRGVWVSRVEADREVIPISLEADIAETLRLDLGDQLVVDVLGIEMSLEVASLRRVDWTSLQPNFFMVFPEGVLEGAPQMNLLTTKTTGAASSAKLQQAIVSGWPNVNCFDLTEAVRTLEEVLGKASAAVSFLAALCMSTGFLLLASAIWNSRAERMGEWALLRTLGAGRGQMAAMTLIEYFLLGLFAAMTGLVLAVGANWALGTFLFKVPPFPNPSVLLGALFILPGMTLILGWLGLRSVWRVSPRYVLVNEDA